MSLRARLDKLAAIARPRYPVSEEEIARRTAAWEAQWPAFAAAFGQILEDHLAGLEPEERERRIAEWTTFYQDALRSRP